MIRSYSARVDVIRNGATLTTLHHVSDPLVDCNADAPIKTSMSGIFRNDAKVNWLTDELMPYQIIDGVEYPVGVFPVGTVSYGHDENGAETVTVEAYDRCMILNQTKTGVVLNWEDGASIARFIDLCWKNHLNGNLTVDDADISQFTRRNLTQKMAQLFDELTAKNLDK